MSKHPTPETPEGTLIKCISLANIHPCWASYDISLTFPSMDHYYTLRSCFIGARSTTCVELEEIAPQIVGTVELYFPNYWFEIVEDVMTDEDIEEIVSESKVYARVIKRVRKDILLAKRYGLKCSYLL